MRDALHSKLIVSVTLASGLSSMEGVIRRPVRRCRDSIVGDVTMELHNSVHHNETSPKVTAAGSLDDAGLGIWTKERV